MALVEYFSKKKDGLCEDCLQRLESNPLRILDCKVKSCQALFAEAPVTLDHLSTTSADHFKKVQDHLNELGRPFESTRALSVVSITTHAQCLNLLQKVWARKTPFVVVGATMI